MDGDDIIDKLMEIYKKKKQIESITKMIGNLTMV